MITTCAAVTPHSFICTRKVDPADIPEAEEALESPFEVHRTYNLSYHRDCICPARKGIIINARLRCAIMVAIIFHGAVG
jgi:hypothetical protein